MKAECVICMECFQSSDVISASRCGHVFHHGCITRWLRESGIHCPQCRSVIVKVTLTRLFFTESSPYRATSTTATSTTSSQCEIDVLETNANKLRAECRQKTDKIAELTKANQQKEKNLVNQMLKNHESDQSLDAQTSLNRKLTKTLEKKEALMAQKVDEMKKMAENFAKIVDSQDLKAQTADEVNTSLASRNVGLAKRCEKLKDAYDALRVENVRSDRECNDYKCRLGASQLLVEQLKSECERKEQDTKALQSKRERQRLDRQARLTKETEANAAFDAELVQLADQIAWRVKKRSEVRLELETDDDSNAVEEQRDATTATVAVELLDDSGLSS